MSRLNVSLPRSKNHDKGEQAAEPVNAPDKQCKSIELRIIQDGKIYRSKAEQERLVALGQWHHRRQRRRERFHR